MAGSTAEQLKDLVAKLQEERKQHTDAIAEIDRTFERIGMLAPGTGGPETGRPRRGRPPGKRQRQRYAQSGGDSLVERVRAGGKTGATSAELTDQWKNDGRPGTPFNILGQLVRDGRLKKHNIKGARGSRYTLG